MFLAQVAIAHKLMNESIERLKNEGIQIVAYSQNSVHVYAGLDIIAAQTGREIKISERNCAVFPYEASLVYCGVRYFELRKGREVRK